eukprot:m.110156 g.110156  ORF g.110156 m.110156 type:complete len:812 (-) comp28018_c0_seq1:424-2859(-)
MATDSAGWLFLEMDRFAAEDLLRDKEEGCFVVRNSSRPGCFTLTIRQASISKPCHHCLILAQSGPRGMKYALQKSQRIFTSLEELTYEYSQRIPSGQQLPCKLRFPGTELASTITEDDVGKSVEVDGYACRGVLKFFGKHQKNGMTRCGIELEDALGINNGTVHGYCYFECGPNHGILCRPDKVKIVEAEEVVPPPPPPASNRPPLREPSRETSQENFMLAPPPVPTTRRPTVSSTPPPPRVTSNSRRPPAAIPSPAPEIPTSPRPTATPTENKFMFDGEDWWIGMINGTDSAKFLSNGQVGDFIVRESQSTEDCYVLAVLKGGRNVVEYKIKHEGGLFTFYNVVTRSEAYPEMHLLIEGISEEAKTPAAHLFKDCKRLRTRFEVKKDRESSDMIDKRMHEMTKVALAVPTDFGLEFQEWYVDSCRDDVATQELQTAAAGTFVVVPHINDSYVLLVKARSEVKRIPIERMGGIYRVPSTGGIHPSLEDIVGATKNTSIPGRHLFEAEFARAPTKEEQRRGASMSGGVRRDAEYNNNTNNASDEPDIYEDIEDARAGQPGPSISPRRLLPEPSFDDDNVEEDEGTVWREDARELPLPPQEPPQPPGRDSWGFDEGGADDKSNNVATDDGSWDSWFVGPMERQMARQHLEQFEDGDFFVRESLSDAGAYVACLKIGGKVTERKIAQEGGEWLVASKRGGVQGFDTIEQLVDGIPEALNPIADLILRAVEGDNMRSHNDGMSDNDSDGVCENPNYRDSTQSFDFASSGDERNDDDIKGFDTTSMTSAMHNIDDDDSDEESAYMNQEVVDDFHDL